LLVSVQVLKVSSSLTSARAVSIILLAQLLVADAAMVIAVLVGRMLRAAAVLGLTGGHLDTLCGSGHDGIDVFGLRRPAPPTDVYGEVP
jgi:hypothetical protein